MIGGTPAPFSALARSGDPPLDRMLLSLAAEFHSIDHGAALDELDELARPLFGVALQRPRTAGERIAAALREEARLRPVTASIEGLLLDRVLSHRRGHPALLAAVYVEVARRAGMPLCLLSSPQAWFAGLVADDEVVVLDPAPELGGSHARLELRQHCAHELAHAVLSGLTNRFRLLGCARRARRAAELRLLLPLGAELLSRTRQELRELEREEQAGS
jgi:regulator of sirC expression with transglutaminase-like and TPR domain